MEHLLNRFSFQYPFLSGFNSNIHFKVLNLFYRIGINTFHLVRAQTAIYFIVRSNLVRVNDVGTFRSISHCCQTYKRWCRGLCSALPGTGWRQVCRCPSALSSWDFARGLTEEKRGTALGHSVADHRDASPIVSDIYLHLHWM